MDYWKPMKSNRALLLTLTIALTLLSGCASAHHHHHRQANVKIETQSQKITPFLWFENQAQEAAAYYTSIFKHSKIITSNPMSATFELEGVEFMALNGGPQFKFNPAVSFFVKCPTQTEIDYYWTKLGAGGEPGRCGWLKDKFGVSWQIVPPALGELLGDQDPAKARRVAEAMMQMTKLDIARLQQAYEGR